jgi:hypothetical protein
MSFKERQTVSVKGFLVSENEKICDMYMCTHILKLRDREAEREKKVKRKRTAYVQV